jgi:hypothetical protein
MRQLHFNEEQKKREESSSVRSITLQWTITSLLLKNFIAYTTTYLKRIHTFFIIIPSGVRLSPLSTAAIIDLLCQPCTIDDGDRGAIGGMKIGRGNRSTRRKPAPVSLCPLQSPHDLTRTRTRAAGVRKAATNRLS